MYFKLMQAIVAVITAIISLIAPQTPSQGITPSTPPVNVNPNPIAESASTQDVKIMSYKHDKINKSKLFLIPVYFCAMHIIMLNIIFRHYYIPFKILIK